MKEILRELFNEPTTDGITFTPVNKTGDMEIKSFRYEKRSKYIKDKLGHYYHILLYKVDTKGELSHKDCFDAILTDPYVYVDNIIKCGFFGLVAKKTKSSKKIVKEIFASIE